ncbi:MAG: sodium/solute symporter [Pseudomonadota bacterium]
MDKVGISVIDTAIIVVYFIAILGFGSYFGRFTKNTKDFFFSGQRFSWWFISMSCVATLVGSYSFIKYADVAYRFGFSSTMTYMNDWFFMPLWMFGWLPIIYFGRIQSIPEYFQKRFDEKTRVAATVILLLYMIGYIGINLYTLGVAFNALIPMGVYWWAIIVAVICAIYVTAGGQTSVVMTDLLQGFLLLIAGFALFLMGIHYLGGFDVFWQYFPEKYRFALADFNKPSEFNFVGIFWQDAIGSTLALYFMNQGMIMRFLSARSVREGRKAMIAMILVLTPLTTIAVCNVGWIGRAMNGMGIIPDGINSKEVFVIVTNMICKPGIFGLILAALIAALMSTIDTLINAVAAVTVNDVVRPYFVKNREDKYYLKVARYASILTAFIGVLLVPLFAQFKSIYAAHGAFVAAVSPPLIVAILLGAFWKRYNITGAFLTLTLGSVLTFLSTIFPHLILPFSHGVDPNEGLLYIRACYSFFISGLVGVVFTLLTKPQEDSAIKGLTIWTLDAARSFFKGSKANPNAGKKIKMLLKASADVEEGFAVITTKSAQSLSAEIKDMLFVEDKRFWYGGLRSSRVNISSINEALEDIIYLNKNDIEDGKLVFDEIVKVELVI